MLTATVVAQLPEIGQLNRSQIAKLVGVAPLVNDSGQKTGVRKTYAGRHAVRRVLYMAALVATKHNRIIRCILRLVAGSREGEESRSRRLYEKTIDDHELHDSKERTVANGSLNPIP